MHRVARNTPVCVDEDVWRALPCRPLLRKLFFYRCIDLSAVKATVFASTARLPLCTSIHIYIYIYVYTYVCNVIYVCNVMQCNVMQCNVMHVCMYVMYVMYVCMYVT